MARKLSGQKIIDRLYEIEEGLAGSTRMWATMRNAKNVELCMAKRDLIRELIEEFEGKEIWK